MVERQTENLKVKSSILFTDIMINYTLLIAKKKNKKLSKNINYNNFKKLAKIDKFLTQKIYLKKKTIYYSFLNFQQFNSMYLYHIFRLNFQEKYLNSLHIIPKKITKYIIFKTRFKSFKFFGIKYFNEILYMLIINFLLKNSKNIAIFIKNKLDTTHFKRHRAYFLFFFRLLKRYIIPNFSILHVKGVSLKFKGKLGRGGNSRKKTLFF